MNTVSKLFVEPNAYRLESTLQSLVKSYNERHQSILDRYDVTEQDVEIIRYLDEQEQMKMKEVGEYFQIKLSTLTSTIDKLEKAKLVKRKNSKEDRRVIFIHPTTRGRNLLSELAEPSRIVSQRAIEELKADQFQLLINTLDNMVEELR